MGMFRTLVAAAIVGTIAYSYGVDAGKREVLHGASGPYESAPKVQVMAGRTPLQQGKLAAANVLDAVQHEVLPRLAGAVNSAGQVLRHAARDGPPAPPRP